MPAPNAKRHNSNRRPPAPSRPRMHPYQAPPAYAAATRLRAGSSSLSSWRLNVKNKGRAPKLFANPDASFVPRSHEHASARARAPRKRNWGSTRRGCLGTPKFASASTPGPRTRSLVQMFAMVPPSSPRGPNRLSLSLSSAPLLIAGALLGRRWGGTVVQHVRLAVWAISPARGAGVHGGAAGVPTGRRSDTARAPVKRLAHTRLRQQTSLEQYLATAVWGDLRMSPHVPRGRRGPCR